MEKQGQTKTSMFGFSNLGVICSLPKQSVENAKGIDKEELKNMWKNKKCKITTISLLSQPKPTGWK